MWHYGTNGKYDGIMEGIPVDLDEGSVKTAAKTEIMWAWANVWFCGYHWWWKKHMIIWYIYLCTKNGLQKHNSTRAQPCKPESNSSGIRFFQTKPNDAWETFTPGTYHVYTYIYIYRERVCVCIYIYINIYIYLCLCIQLSIHFALHSIDVSVQLSKGTCTKAAGVAAVWDVAAVHRSFTRKVKSLKRSTGSCWMCLRLSHGLSASMARKSLRWENHRTKWGMASSKPR